MVTGGAGFVGSHLVDALVSYGGQVMCVDNLSTGSVDNLSNVIGCKNFHLIEYDIGDGDVMSKAMQVYGGIDIVFHLAAQSSVSRSIVEPVHFVLLEIQDGARLFHCKTVCCVQ